MKKPDPTHPTSQAENEKLRERLKTAEQTIRDLRLSAGAPDKIGQIQTDPRNAAAALLRRRLDAHETELRLTRELLESVTEGTGAIVATIDTDYRYTYFNRTHHKELKRLTGKDTTLGMRLTDVLADFPAERDAALALWTRALSGETVSQTIEFGDPGRYRRYYATRHTPIRDAHGAILGAGEITFDITGQIAAEKALRESVLETASVAKFPAENPNPVLRVSPAGVLLYANDAAAELLAFHACAVGAPVPEAWRSSLAAPIAQWRRGQFEIEWRDRHYSFDVVPIREADYINLYGRDVTELRGSETRYRMLAENSPDLITRLDKDLRFTYANTRLLSLAGVKAGDLVGRLVGDLKLPEGVLAFLTEARARAIETPDTRETEFELPLAGSRRIFNIRVVPEHAPDGALESFLLIGHDITGFRESRRELERTRDYLNKLLNYANAPVIVWDPQSRITMFNHAFERLTGYPAGEVIGRELTLLFPEESSAASLDKIRQTLDGEYLETVEIPIRQKAGGVRTVLWNSANVCAEDGTTLTATIAQGQDITERKLAEEALSEAHAEAVREKNRLEAVMETLPVGVALLDRQGGKVRYNRMFDEVWGGEPPKAVSTEDFTQYQGWWLDSGQPVAIDQWAASIALSRGRQVVGQMVRIRRFDGREAYALNGASPIFEADGSIAGCAVAIQDITHRVVSERAIEESEKRYRTIFNGMTEGFALHEIILDEAGAPADYRFIDVNPAFETLTGISRDDVIGKTKNEVPQLAGDDPVWIERYGRVALSGEAAHFDNFSPALRRHYEVYAYCPMPRHFAVVFMDVTERKRRERELQTLNRTLKALGESNHALLAATDERTYLDAVCRIVVQDCGYSMVWIGFAENDEARTVRPAAHAGFEDGYIETLKVSWADTERGRGPTGTAVRTGEVRMCRNMQADPAFAPWREEASKRGYASSIAIPLRAGADSFGAITIYSAAVDPFLADEVRLLTGLADDVAMGIATIRTRAARNTAEAALRESERRFQIIIKNSPVSFFLQDPELTYRWIYNPTQHFAERSIVGKTDAELYDADQARELTAHKRAVIESGRGERFEFHGVEQEKEYDQLIALEPHRDSDGRMLGVYGVSLDITARKQAEAVLERDRETLERLIAERTDELMTARTELEMSRRLSDIGTLAATVAHELRNPLAAITVAAANIQRKAKNPLLESHLVNIKKKVNESDQIINNLLFFSRIKAPRYQVTELHQLIDECLETAGLHARDRITVNKKVDAVRGVAIEADPVQLQEVFTNLMNNARDALGERGGNIDIHASREPDRITIKIADDGMGIDEKDLERVFEPFFTTKARGTGLGLAVCRQIIALHGGTISIDSAVGKGTAVVVSLPKKA